MPAAGDPAAWFLPNAGRAARLDREMHRRLAESLNGIGTALAAAGGETAGLSAFAAAARQNDVTPAVFALHAGLVEAILAEDEAAVAALLTAAGRMVPTPAAGIACVTLDDAALGFVGAADIYRRLAVADADADVALAAIPAAGLGSATEQVRAALGLVAEAAPALSGEISALLRQVVLVRTGEGSRDAFGGAATFHIWGAVFLNADRQAGRVAAAEGLVHEAAHLLLFAESGGTPLVLNDAGERHPSPLRADPRPLDGIAHATFVLARMAYCQERLISSGLLSPEERAEAEAALLRNQRDYADGAAVLRRHARPTEAGARLLAAAAHYMSELQTPAVAGA
jgi:HEXXH motif-containing protein